MINPFGEELSWGVLTTPIEIVVEKLEGMIATAHVKKIKPSENIDVTMFNDCILALLRRCIAEDLRNIKR